MFQTNWYTVLLKMYISHGSVATRVWCSGIFNNNFIANIPQSVPLKEFRKSVENWQKFVDVPGLVYQFILEHGVYTDVPRESMMAWNILVALHDHQFSKLWFHLFSLAVCNFRAQKKVILFTSVW